MFAAARSPKQTRDFAAKALMRAAQQLAAKFDTRARKNDANHAVAVYTPAAGNAAPDDPTADSASQESLNASV